VVCGQYLLASPAASERKYDVSRAEVLFLPCWVTLGGMMLAVTLNATETAQLALCEVRGLSRDGEETNQTLVNTAALLP
jgi:hypothetical protein